MSPWIARGRGAPDHQHECRPPSSWPWVSRRRYPDGSVWECDAVVPFGMGQWPMRNVCCRRWELAWSEDGPRWSRLVPKKPGVPPVGPAGARRGGYISPPGPVLLPKVPDGPAPGAAAIDPVERGEWNAMVGRVINLCQHHGWPGDPAATVAVGDVITALRGRD